MAGLVALVLAALLALPWLVDAPRVQAYIAQAASLDARQFKGWRKKVRNVRRRTIRHRGGWIGTRARDEPAR